MKFLMNALSHFVQNIQENLETSIRGSDVIFD